MISELDRVHYSFSSDKTACFPSCVQLTLSHYICDSACISCPVGRLNRGDPEAHARWKADGGVRMFMKWTVFEKAVRETGKHPEAFLRFHGRGEPTLHPRFVEMIAFAKSVGVNTIQVFTNGITMSEDLAWRTLDAGLDVIEFSVHGHTETYQTLMGNDHFEQVRDNIIRFIQLRDRLGKKTKVVVSAVDQPDFQPDKDAHRQYWTGKVDQVILRPYHSWGGRIPQRDAEIPRSRRPCPQFWTRLTIGPTGNILFCFNSWDEDKNEVAANLMESDVTITNVWQSEKYTRVREAHVAGHYTLQCCAQCTDWVGSSWGENSYETLLQKLQEQSPSQEY